MPLVWIFFFFFFFRKTHQQTFLLDVSSSVSYIFCYLKELIQQLLDELTIWTSICLSEAPVAQNCDIQ